MKSIIRKFSILIILFFQFSIVSSQQSESKLIEILNEADSIQNPIQSLQVLQSISDLGKANDSLKARYYYLMGVGHGMLYNVDTSKLYFEKALSFSESAGSILSQLGSLNGLANLATITSENELAKEYYEKSLNLAESREEEIFVRWKAQILGNLGGIFFSLNNYQTAHDYSIKAYSTALSISDSLGMARNLIQLGYSFIKLHKADSAMIVNLEATDILERIDDSYLLTFQYFNLGEIFLDANNLKESENYFLKSEELARKYNEAESLADCLNALAEIAIKRGSNSKARNLIDPSLEVSLEHGLLPHQQKSYHLSYQLERQQKNLAIAMNELINYHLVKDSILQQETINSIEEFKVRYETAKKEQKIAEVNSLLEKKQRFQYFLFTIIGVIIVFGAITFLLITQRYKLKQALLSQEIDTLRAEIKSALEPESINFQIDKEKIDHIAITPLSDRETEILSFAMSNFTNHEIAEKAFVSVNTVKFHLKNIYGKLGVGNTREALQIALQPSE